MDIATAVTAELAEAALAAVREQFRSYLEPLAIEGSVYAPLCGEPTLVMDYNGAPAIVWEDGPDEWAYRVSDGGASESERVLVAQAAEEFGVPYTPPAGVAPAELPAGVHGEPYASFVLSLYPTEVTR